MNKRQPGNHLNASFVIFSCHNISKVFCFALFLPSSSSFSSFLGACWFVSLGLLSFCLLTYVECMSRPNWIFRKLGGNARNISYFVFITISHSVWIRSIRWLWRFIRWTSTCWRQLLRSFGTHHRERTICFSSLFAKQLPLECACGKDDKDRRSEEFSKSGRGRTWTTQES